MRRYLKPTAGFTFLEILFAVAIGALVLIALSLLIARVVGVNRYDYEQILITEDARINMTKMTDAIRDAIDVQSGWLVSATNYSLHIKTDAGGGVAQDITYALSGTDLTQTITRPNGSPEVTVLSHDIRNQSMSKPVFALYNLNGQQLVPESANSNGVRKIVITLEIDVNPNQPPDTVELVTNAIPRASLGSLNVVTPLLATTIHYPTDVATSGTSKVETLNSDNTTSSQVWPISLLNLSHLTTYDGLAVNINYQSTSQGSFTPGWYAWVGPILVVESGSQKYYATDQVPINQLCTGQDLSVMVSSCAERTVSTGGNSVQYQPIIMYTNSGTQSFVKTILFDWDGFSTATPTPSPTP